MKCNRTISTVAAVFVFALLFTDFALAKNKIICPNDLELTISGPNTVVKQGDRIPIVLTITNKGKQTCVFDDMDYDRSGRLPDYVLVAKSENGTRVADPLEDWLSGFGGGLGGYDITLTSGMTYKKTLALNQWAFIDKPGHYTVTAKMFKSCHIYDSNVTDPNEIHRSSAYKQGEFKLTSQPLDVVVKPRTYDEMGEYIDTLLYKLQLLADSNESDSFGKTEFADELKEKLAFISNPNQKLFPSDKKREIHDSLLEKLAYTCDERTALLFIDFMYHWNAHNDIYYGSRALICYLPKTKNIKDQVLKAARDRCLGGNMSWVMDQLNCSASEYREVIAPSLVSNDINIVGNAILSAQEHPDDTHMKRLIDIANTSGCTEEINLDDANGPEEYNIKEQKQQECDEIATNRDRAIIAVARNRTDEGVKTLKTLLEIGDKNVIRDVNSAIRGAYYRHNFYPEDCDKEYTALLVKIAKDPNHPIRWQAFNEIFMTRTQKSAEALQALLKNPDVDVEAAKTDEGVAVIKEMLKSPDEDMRKMAADSIESWYKKHPGRPLRKDDFPQFVPDPNKRKEGFLKSLAKYQEQSQTD